MTHWKIWLCGILLLFATGCVDIQVKTRIDSDGSGVQSWRFVTTALLASDLKKQIESDSFFSKHGKMKDEFKEGDYILTIDVPFDRVDDLKVSGREVQFKNSGFLRSTCSYKEVWDRSFQDPNSVLTKRAESIVPVTMKVTVTMPGKIIDSNAENNDGQSATWNISLNDLTQPKTLTVTSRKWNVGILIALLMVVSTAVALGFFLLNSGGRALLTKKLVCPACKSVLPSGSAFCNRCGVSVPHN